MTAENPINVSQFIVNLIESAYEVVTSAAEGLSDEQLYHQPSEGANSVAWLAWHLYRWQDRQSATATGTSEVWESEGWANRFGIPAERTGLGDTAEQVAAFQPPRDLLLGYVDAVHTAFAERLGGLDDDALGRPMQYIADGEARPVWRALLSVCGDTTQHAGQIAYLRGMLTEQGWFGA